MSFLRLCRRDAALRRLAEVFAAAADFFGLLVEEGWPKTVEEQMMNATTIRTSDRIFTMKLELPSPMSEL